MNPYLSRRTLLKTTASGFGYLAFAGLTTWAAEKEKAKSPLAPKKPHFEPKAKRVIFLCMDGAPSHVDTFDYKPKLTADDGKAFGKGRLFNAKLLGSPWKFSSTAKAACGFQNCFPMWPNMPMNSVCCTACIPMSPLIPRPSCKCIPASPSSAPFDGGVDALRSRHRERKLAGLYNSVPGGQ